jgi:hypothetical protein
MATTTLDYLIPDLRVLIGDLVEPYRYLDTWLGTSLLIAVKALNRRWNFRYLVTSTDISRNPGFNFLDPEPPVILPEDEHPILLQAAIIILGGSLENSAWNVASWADAEIRYTNIDAGKLRDASLKRFMDELDAILLPPTKRLAGSRKQSLIGYKNNPFEG